MGRSDAMKAMVLPALGKPLELRTVPVPPIGPNDVLLRVRRAGMCGTDAAEYTTGPHFVPLHARHPASGHEGPTILGHEFVGEVVARGAGVGQVREGQRVAAGAGVWCGRCRHCLAQAAPCTCPPTCHPAPTASATTSRWQGTATRSRHHPSPSRIPTPSDLSAYTRDSARRATLKALDLALMGRDKRSLGRVASCCAVGT